MEKNDPQKSLIQEALRLLSEQYEDNEEFNEDYNNGDKIFLGDLDFDKSLALFWLDRQAYDAEKVEWENKTIQEQHEDCITLLRETDQIAPFLEIVEAVHRKRIVPFVGAGFSKPMGMPRWDEALQELHDKRLNLNNAEFAEHLEQERYLHAAQLLANHNQTITNNFIRTRFRVSKIEGPVQLLPFICNGCVVTTNFDCAIEEVFKQAGKQFDAYMHGTQQHNFFSRLVKGEHCILKLHGDANDDPTTFVFTLNQYTNAYGDPFDFTKPLPKALRQIFISSSLLFVGCSLNKDWTLKLFKKVRDQKEYEVPDHYAILEEPETPEAKHEKETDLLEHNIQPIWYPMKKHEYVEKLLRLIIDVKDKRIALPPR